MARYFFDIDGDGSPQVDTSGFDLDDVEAARTKAEAILEAELRKGPKAVVVSVRDGAGHVIHAEIAVG